MEWELRHVEDTEAVLDDSEVYVVVHRIETPETHKQYAGIRVTVRADLMQGGYADDGRTNVEPIMSFEGTASAVRKAVIRFLTGQFTDLRGRFSREHAAYIGYELHRAELTPNYQQD